MADILIRGMEMPESCEDCHLVEETENFYGDIMSRVCNLIYKGYTSEAQKGGRLPGCPLVPLQAGHGRLIDADALDRAFTDLRFNSDGTLNHWGDRPGWCMHGYEVEKLIADAPTIIEAEGGTDECSEN